MRKNVNSVELTGRLFSHTLERKVGQNPERATYGKEYISGAIQLAIDDEGTNVVEVRYPYVAPTFNSGKANKSFTVLEKVMASEATFEKVGTDAMKLKLSPSIALSDFPIEDGTMVSAKKLESGFVDIITTLDPDVAKRNKFKADMLITKTRMIDADEEKNIPENILMVGGVIFNFRNEILPVEFSVKNPKGIEAFESFGIDAQNPVYTTVWGNVNCNTIKIDVVEESAFGEAFTKTVERKTKEYLITGTSHQDKHFEFGEEGVLTVEELKACQQNREILLATIKKEREEWQAKKAAGDNAFTTSAPVPTPSTAPTTASIPNLNSFNF